MRRLVASVVVLLLLAADDISAYPSSVPLNVCGTLMPAHGSASAQNSAPPYTITTSVNCFKLGETINVTLSGAGSSTSFRGFLLMAVNPDVNGAALGSFSTNGQTDIQTLDCFGQTESALSHANSNTRLYKSFQWTAPTDSLDTIVLSATVVQSKTVFWLGVKRSLSPCVAVGGGTGDTGAVTPSREKTTVQEPTTPGVGSTVGTGGTENTGGDTGSTSDTGAVTPDRESTTVSAPTTPGIGSTVGAGGTGSTGGDTGNTGGTGSTGWTGGSDDSSSADSSDSSDSSFEHHGGGGHHGWKPWHMKTTRSTTKRSTQSPVTIPMGNWPWFGGFGGPGGHGGQGGPGGPGGPGGLGGPGGPGGRGGQGGLGHGGWLGGRWKRSSGAADE